MNREYHLKYIATFLLVLICCFHPCILVVDSNSTVEKTTDSEYLINYPSYVDLDYNSSVLEKELIIGQSYALPLTISYWTRIPDNFIKFLPETLRNLILFDQKYPPLQTITISVLDEPEWATISFSSSTLTLPIPIDDSVYQVDTILSIIVHKNAPAQSYTIDIQAQWESIGKLSGGTYQESISFTPAFIPRIDISVDDHYISAAPMEEITIPIDVMNMGNKMARVIPRFIGLYEGWNTVIDPPVREIPTKDISQFMVRLRTPDGFSGFKTVHIQFDVESYPIKEGRPTQSYPLYLIVHAPT
jgi:hypothetical protein